MTRKPYLAATVCGSVLLSLTACAPSTDDSQSDFFVASAGQGGVSGYSPQGWGWKPNSKVSIEIFDEPDGPGSANSNWKHIFDVNVYGDGLFGFTNGQIYPVRRSICGNPENLQTLTFMAKSLTTGKIRMYRAPADLYFTFQPCH